MESQDSKILPYCDFRVFSHVFGLTQYFEDFYENYIPPVSISDMNILYNYSKSSGAHFLRIVLFAQIGLAGPTHK